MLIGESNVAIDPGPAIGGYGAADIYLGEFSPHHMDSAEFSKWSRRMAFELGVFCRQERNAPDLRTLACSTDLEKALNNHGIPNPFKFWACIAILRKNTDYPREQIIMRAHEKFRLVKYDPTAWVDDYLASLLLGLRVGESR